MSNTTQHPKYARVEKYHEQAMDFYEQALLAKLKGTNDANLLLQKAYTLEAQAAGLVERDYAFEPSRSILLRSAATLALRSGLWREAERLVCSALAGTPPEPLIHEFRDLMDTIEAERQVYSYSPGVPDNKLLERLYRAIGVAASVHHLPDLPHLRLGSLEATSAVVTFADTGSEIVIDPNALYPELDMLHVLAHFLDFQALGVPNTFASDVADFMVSWRSAVEQTRAVQHLKQIHSDAGVPENLRVSKYTLQFHELFARSYVQYICIKSQDAGLNVQFARLHHDVQSRIYCPQWDWEDFSGVAQAIDSVFLAKGWIYRDSLAQSSPEYRPLTFIGFGDESVTPRQGKRLLYDLHPAA